MCIGVFGEMSKAAAWTEAFKVRIFENTHINMKRLNRDLTILIITLTKF